MTDYTKHIGPMKMAYNYVGDFAEVFDPATWDEIEAAFHAAIDLMERATLIEANNDTTLSLQASAAAHGMPDTYACALDEVEAWRGAAEGAFGVVTTDPRGTLVGIAIRLEEHHQEHHAREAALEARVAELEAAQRVERGE